MRLIQGLSTSPLYPRRMNLPRQSRPSLSLKNQQNQRFEFSCVHRAQPIWRIRRNRRHARTFCASDMRSQSGVSEEADGVLNGASLFAAIVRSQSGVSESTGGMSVLLEGGFVLCASFSASMARSQSGVSEEISGSSTAFPESLNAPSSVDIECNQSCVPPSDVGLSNESGCEGCCNF